MSQQKSPRFFYGWVVVWASAVIMTLMFGAFYSFGIFFKSLLNEFGWTRAQTSLAFSLSFFCQGFLGMLMGKLNDRFGPRFVGMLSSILVGGGFLLMSLITAKWQLYLIYGIIIAAGVSGGIGLQVTPTRWFNEKRGLATGIVLAGVGMATVIGAPLANWLIVTYNWRHSYVIIGISAFVLMFLASQFLRREPAQMGLKPYGQVAPRARALASASDSSFGQAVRSWQFWVLGSIFLFHTFCSQTILTHLAIAAQGAGLSAANAAIAVSINGGASIVGRLSFGFMLDKLGSRPILALAFLVKGLALAWLVFAHQEWAFYAFAAVFGLGYGGATIGHAPMAADLFGVSSITIIIAGVSLIGNVGASGGPWVAGRIFDVTGSYFWAFVLDVIASFLGLGATLMMKPLKKRQKIEA
ncbi:MAG: MFS transporter [Chloroflexota bacterium]